MVKFKQSITAQVTLDVVVNLPDITEGIVEINEISNVVLEQGSYEMVVYLTLYIGNNKKPCRCVLDVYGALGEMPITKIIRCDNVLLEDGSSIKAGDLITLESIGINDGM